MTVTGIGFYGADLVYKKEVPPRRSSELLKEGASIFEKNCSICHFSESTEKKMAVGLKGIMKHKNLPVSKKPATDENIRKLLKRGFQTMPPFSDLKEDEVMP